MLSVDILYKFYIHVCVEPRRECLYNPVSFQGIIHRNIIRRSLIDCKTGLKEVRSPEDVS